MGAHSHKIRDIAQLITSGAKCNFQQLGDSHSVLPNSTNWRRAVLRSWDVDWRGQWNAYFASAAPDEGFITFFNAPTKVLGDTMADGVTVHPGGMSSTSIRHTTNLGNFSTGYCRANLASLNHYRNGDWTSGEAITAKLAFLGGADPYTRYRVRYLRGNATVGTVNEYNPNVLPLVAGEFSVGEINFSASSTDSTGLYNGHVEINLDNAAGRDETNTITYLSGVGIFRTGKTDGFHYYAHANGGWNTLDLIPVSEGGDGAELAEQVLRFDACDIWPDVYGINIGTNIATGEWNGTNVGNYTDNVRTIIQLYRDLHTANGKSAPLFLLYNCWQAAAGSNDYPAARGIALREIADESEDVGVMDINQMVLDKHGAYASWQPTYLRDAAHLADAGCLEFGTLVWDELVRAASNPLFGTPVTGIRSGRNPALSSGLRMPGRVR